MPIFDILSYVTCVVVGDDGTALEVANRVRQHTAAVRGPRGPSHEHQDYLQAGNSSPSHLAGVRQCRAPGTSVIRNTRSDS